eukprot:gnl/MRDRNA2_/MRDRNA2_108474_c0_seq1.p1 gnl/MRDRNA2_/MRDRNA2_108474_c0~~gnl/MRDRNA2_/MRDRNA2_108474_c0_seq1.p1  ORF type:complete len:401 (+),score=45.55 gnl/MRDRNA2_/MRDRNA2_108474_c0_seq1:187-1389(+)
MSQSMRILFSFLIIPPSLLAMKSGTCKIEDASAQKDSSTGANVVDEELYLMQNLMQIHREMQRTSLFDFHSGPRSLSLESRTRIKEMLQLIRSSSSEGKSEESCQLDSFTEGLPEEAMWKCLKVVSKVPCPNASAIEVLVKDMNMHKSKFTGAQTPRIFHQSWKSHELSQQQKESKNSFLSRHPGWNYRLWNDTENLDLIKKETPWLLPLYKSYPEEIFRADLARLVYMYVYGGVYADMDYFFEKNIELLSREPGVVLGQMEVDFKAKDRSWTWPHMVPNALLIGKPRHPFWRLALEMAASPVLTSVFKDPNSVSNPAVQVRYEDQSPEYFTGPVLLLRAVQCYSKLPQIQTNNTAVHVAPPIAFFPVSWAMNTTANQEHCIKSRKSMIYGSTSWAHTWR